MADTCPHGLRRSSFPPPGAGARGRAQAHQGRGRPLSGGRRDRRPGEQGGRARAALRERQGRVHAPGHECLRDRPAAAEGARAEVVRRHQRQDRRPPQARAAARLRRGARGVREARLDGARTAEEGEVGQRPRAGGRPHRRRRGPGSAACALHLARGRRLLLQPGAHPHQAPGDRRTEPGALPAPAPRPAHHRDALADPQGQPQPLPGRRQARRATARRDRVRGAACGDVRLHGPAAWGHRRVPLRRVHPGQADRDGGLQDRAAAGPGARGGRHRGVAGTREDASRGAVRRPHRVLHAAGALPRAHHRLRDHAEASPAPVDRGGGRRPRTARWGGPPSGSSCRS